MEGVNPKQFVLAQMEQGGNFARKLAMDLCAYLPSNSRLVVVSEMVIADRQV